MKTKDNPAAPGTNPAELPEGRGCRGRSAGVLAPDAVEYLLDISPYMFGWLGKPRNVLDGASALVAINTSVPTKAFGVEITENVALTDAPAAPDATLEIPAESWLRLVAGRLAPEHTPAGVSATGRVTVDQLRQIFPGF